MKRQACWGSLGGGKKKTESSRAGPTSAHRSRGKGCSWGEVWGPRRHRISSLVWVGGGEKKVSKREGRGGTRFLANHRNQERVTGGEKGLVTEISGLWPSQWQPNTVEKGEGEPQSPRGREAAEPGKGEPGK